MQAPPYPGKTGVAGHPSARSVHCPLFAITADRKAAGSHSSGPIHPLQHSNVIIADRVSTEEVPHHSASALLPSLLLFCVVRAEGISEAVSPPWNISETCRDVFGCR